MTFIASWGKELRRLDEFGARQEARRRHRQVFVYDLNPRYVIKVEKPAASRTSSSNEIWQWVKTTQYAKWFAPGRHPGPRHGLRWSAPAGAALVVPYPKRMPEFSATTSIPISAAARYGWSATTTARDHKPASRCAAKILGAQRQAHLVGRRRRFGLRRGEAYDDHHRRQGRPRQARSASRQGQAAYGRFKKLLDELGQGEIFTLDYWFPREGWKHRKHFAMLAMIFDAQEQFADPEQLRMWLKSAPALRVRAGPEGQGRRDPEEHRLLVEDRRRRVRRPPRKVKDFLRSEHAQRFLWPHLDPDQTWRPSRPSSGTSSSVKNRVEAAYMGRVAGLGCVICRRLGFGYVPAELHHIAEGSGLRSNFAVAPLCPDASRRAPPRHRLPRHGHRALLRRVPRPWRKRVRPAGLGERGSAALDDGLAADGRGVKPIAIQDRSGALRRVHRWK
jgi:hypothetical protein